MKLSFLILTASAGGFFTTISSFSLPTTFQSNNAILTKKTSSPSIMIRQRWVSPLASFNMGGDVGDTNTQGKVNVIDEFANRDVQGMEVWALQNGVQKGNGVDLACGDSPGVDWQLITKLDIQAGNPVLFVPAGMILSTNAILLEFGDDPDSSGNPLLYAEQALVKSDRLTAQRLPLFRLMVKILKEYEKGEESPYFPWLNSLPRRFYNGVAMTEDCFDCLPPYAARLTSSEKNNYLQFSGAVRAGYIEFSKSTTDDDRILQWAYNVALTRFTEVWQPTRQKLIAPMADMFNHATNPNVEVTFDQEGNCMVYAMDNIPANTPLTISLGDSTNPTPIFAKYGFLHDECRTIFCKAVHLEPQIEELGYDFKDLLFHADTGEIAPKVYDIFLYKILQDNDGNLADQFYTACKLNDEDAKNNFHDQYFEYTLEALRDHVGSILMDVDRLTQKAQSLDLNTHPRAPVIVAHNNLVRETFSKTHANLQAM